MQIKYFLLIGAALLFGACGKPKTYHMNQMHAINPMGTFFVEGTVHGVGTGVTEFKMGDVPYTNLTLEDATGSYTFYFLPEDHPRQPVAKDNVKLAVHFVVLDKSFAGGGRAPIIETIEYKP